MEEKGDIIIIIFNLTYIKIPTVCFDEFIFLFLWLFVILVSFNLKPDKKRLWKKTWVFSGTLFSDQRKCQEKINQVI